MAPREGGERYRNEGVFVKEMKELGQPIRHLRWYAR
jgi:hypothetical protein